MTTDRPIPQRPNVNARRRAELADVPPPPARPGEAGGQLEQTARQIAPAAPVEAPAKKELPPLDARTLADILPLLCRPFRLEHIELKPGATTRDKSRALALPYVDTRIYQGRLDSLAGVAGWAAEFVPWGETRLICRLTILGITKQATGEGDKTDPNCGTIAEAQAFKRACSAFGLGRYLYDLPQLWAAYDNDKKRFADAAGVAREIYQAAGLPLK